MRGPGPRLPFASVRPPIPLSVEAAVLRGAGSAVAARGPRRRHDAAREAPLEARSRRDRPARRPASSRAPRSSRRRTARRRPRRWRPRSSASRLRLAHNNSGANLVSGVASTLLRAGRAELGLFEVDEAALPEVARSAPASRRSCSAISSATSSTATASSSSSRQRWRDGRRVTPRRGARRERRRSAGRRTSRRGRRHADLRARRPAAGTACAAARRRLEVLPALRHAVHLRRGLRRSSRRLPLPERAGTRGRRSTSAAREIELRGLDGAAFTLVAPGGLCARRASRCPGLYNVYNALGAGSLALSLGATVEEVAAGLERFSAAFGRFERISIGDRRLLMLLIKNPAGANEVVRTLVGCRRPARRSRRAERRDRRRARRLLDLGRRLRAAARRPRPGRRHGLACGRARPALRLRRPRRASGSRSSRRSRRPSTAGSS